MRIFTFLERNELHGVVEMVEDDDVLIHDVIDVGRIILSMVVSLTGMFSKYLTALKVVNPESAEPLLSPYMEGRDEVVDTL